MNQTYIAIERIWVQLVDGKSVDIENEILGLLSRAGIKPRQDDGELMQINLSIPTSIEAAFVIGLRYIKKDSTFTEDHFLCQRDSQAVTNPMEIAPYYRGRLESLLSEYVCTHKQTILLPPSRASFVDLPIQVNTISYLKGEDNGKQN